MSTTYAGSINAAAGCAALLSANGSITLTRSAVSGAYGRAAEKGFGAICSGHGSVSLTSSVVSGSKVKTSAGASHGAGIFAQQGLTLSQSTVSNNSAIGAASDSLGKGGGGGIFASGTVVISNSVIDHNLAYYGGGLYLSDAGSVTITNSTIADNTANNSAGAVHIANPLALQGGIATLQNTTVAFNRAPIAGGIMVDTSHQPEQLDLQSSIVADNVAADNPVGADLLVGGSQFTPSTANSLVVSSSVALPGNPVLACPRLEPLANNGGPTRTLALMHDSPAINAGNNGAGEQYDQRGSGFARVYGMMADIGAYEWQGGADDRVFHGGFESGCDE